MNLDAGNLMDYSGMNGRQNCNFVIHGTLIVHLSVGLNCKLLGASLLSQRLPGHEIRNLGYANM